MPKNPTKAFVLPISGHEAEIQMIIGLIKSAGCEVVCEGKAAKSIDSCIDAADVLVVLICPESLTDAQIDKIIVTASHNGKRVVGVWAPTSKGDAALPSAINRYGDAVINCTQKAVKDAICGGSNDWMTPSGSPRETPKTPRHKGK